MDIIWNLPSIPGTLDRLEELYQYLENFPESRLAPAIREEIAHLEELIKYL